MIHQFFKDNKQNNFLLNLKATEEKSRIQIQNCNPMYGGSKDPSQNTTDPDYYPQLLNRVLDSLKQNPPDKNVEGT
jgi:hypothetical protein